MKTACKKLFTFMLAALLLLAPAKLTPLAASEDENWTNDYKVPVLTSITVTKMPTRLQYFVGETVDLSGLAVTGNYSDLSKRAVSASQSSTVDSTTPGKKTVTLLYRNKSTQFEVTYYTRGDVDGNGKLNLKDAAVLAQYLAGHNISVEAFCLDFNQNGTVDLKDLYALFKACLN